MEPNDISPGAVSERISRLQSGIATGLEREAAAVKNRAASQMALRKEMLAREEVASELHHAQIFEIGETRQRETDAASNRAEARRDRAQQAYHASKAALANREQGVKDQRIGLAQGQIMRKRQARQEELARAAEAHADFQQQLQEDRQTRHDLRISTLRSLRTYRPFVRLLFRGKVIPPSAGPCDLPQEIRVHLLAALDDAASGLARARRMPLARLFYFLPLSLLLAVAIGACLWLAYRPGGGGISTVLQTMGIAAGAVTAVWLLGLARAVPAITRIAGSLAVARLLEISAGTGSAARLAALEAEIRAENEQESLNLGESFRESDSEWRERVHRGQVDLDAKNARIPGRLENLHQRWDAKIATTHQAALAAAEAAAADRKSSIEVARAEANSVIDREFDAAIDALAATWKSTAVADFHKLATLETSSRKRFPAWTSGVCETWTPPDEAPSAVRIGEIAVDPKALAGGLPHDARLALPQESAIQRRLAAGPLLSQIADVGMREMASALRAPFSLGFPDHASLLLETSGDGADQATRTLNAISLRLLASQPPGRASFVFIDPVGLGKDFAGLMHLADYEESLINHRIWTQSTQIEERLAELNEHIEKVIQMYLRNEFANLAEYNAQAGTIAEKYRFLVIAGFPASISETACKRLHSIASSGARCGVHLFIHRDTRLAVPDAALEEELRRACTRVVWRDGGFHLENVTRGADSVSFDAPPVAEDESVLVHRIGKASIDSNRVQVPFSHITPPEGEMWTSATADELRVPIGRTGAKKLQMLAIGKGTRQHALVAGKTGSGKSTLFHVIITNLALWCSPEEVEFYLVDFKKGVEFKCYATRKLPHARVIAIESDREFALSVLQRLDAELKRRGELFRVAGSQDLAGYKRTPGHVPMPRSLLLIDEFQEFFTEDDAVAQEASLLLDRIVRQGRAFGIHVILGSQTLGGAYTLARATLGQMVIRIALQCNEADAHLIMDDDNPAPRLLTRPGEGIYNDHAGALAANSPFQIVWLPEDERDAALDRVAERAGKNAPAPIVFEGNAPADVRDNPALKSLPSVWPATRPATAKAWLGAPNSIKGPTEAVFQRQSGSHLLIVGQAAERALSLLGISLVSLASQYPPDGVEFVVLDPHSYDTGANGFLQRIAESLPHKIRIGGPAEAAELLAELNVDLEKRAPSSGKDAPEIFLIVHDLQRFKALRPDDEFRFYMDDDASAAVAPSAAFANLLGEGGPAGIHVLAATDTWNNVSRWIPRKLMAEFEMRVLLQMSANDSANLIDSPAATTLGLHRALFYNEHQGTLETFRPYAMPDEAWLA